MDHKMLREHLEAVGDRAILMEFGRPVRTVEQAAKVSGVPQTRIVKSLVVVDPSGSAYVCLVPGHRHLNVRKVEKVVGVSGIHFASSEEVRRLTGYEAGAVPPIGHRTSVKIIMDKHVATERTVVGGGGTQTALLKVSPEDILRLTGAAVEDVSDG